MGENKKNCVQLQIIIVNDKSGYLSKIEGNLFEGNLLVFDINMFFRGV